jgi:hypothetical protein
VAYGFGRGLLVGLAGGLLALGLSGCGTEASYGLAGRACNHIHESITLYQESLKASTSAEAQKLSAEALAQLRVAMPLAVRAAADDGSWQAMMTTLAESSRVPEQHLITALQDQCDSVNE